MRPRKQWDTWEAHVRSLKEMKLAPVYLGKLLFLTIYENNILSELLRRWERSCCDKEDSEIDVKTFFNFIDREVGMG